MKIYRIEKSETLEEIARRHGTTVDRLLDDNMHIETGEHGDVLLINVGAASPCSPGSHSDATPTTYIVKPADTYEKIAHALNIPEHELRELNNNEHLFIGKQLVKKLNPKSSD